MYRYYISKNLKAKLKKIRKKNRKFYEVIIKKIEEIIRNPQHYKPLRYNIGFAQSSRGEIVCPRL